VPGLNCGPLDDAGGSLLRPLDKIVVEANPEVIERLAESASASGLVDFVDLRVSTTLASGLLDVFPIVDGDEAEAVWRNDGLKDRLALIVNADLMDQADVELFWKAVFRGYEMGPTVVLAGRPGLSDVVANGEFAAGRDFTVLEIAS
jgi:hypothetical protein